MKPQNSKIKTFINQAFQRNGKDESVEIENLPFQGTEADSGHVVVTPQTEAAQPRSLENGLNQ